MAVQVIAQGRGTLLKLAGDAFRILGKLRVAAQPRDQVCHAGIACFLDLARLRAIRVRADSPRG